MWTATLQSADYQRDTLVIIALISDGKRSFTAERSIAPGTISDAGEMEAMVNQWVQDQADRMNKFAEIVDPALAKLGVKIVPVEVKQ